MLEIKLIERLRPDLHGFDFDVPVHFIRRALDFEARAGLEPLHDGRGLCRLCYGVFIHVEICHPFDSGKLEILFAALLGSGFFVVSHQRAPLIGSLPSIIKRESAFRRSQGG